MQWVRSGHKETIITVIYVTDHQNSKTRYNHQISATIIAQYRNDEYQILLRRH